MAAKKAKAAKNKQVKKKIDIGDLLAELQARFDAVEGKLDAIMSRTAGLSRMISTERDPAFKTHATVTKKFPIPQDNGPRERKMHKVICAQCKNECEVPFVPKEGRPVYCKTCYVSRRNESGPRNIPNREEIVAEIAKTLQIGVDAQPKVPAKKKTRAKKAKPKK